MTDFGNMLLVAFGIGMLIFVHELGHYLVARWIGARVEVFSLGFGPRLVGFRRGPTDYRISLIPLGGYVAVAGQEAMDRRYGPDESLHQKTVGQRMLFFSGGVLMNLLFALVAFPIAFHQGVSFPVPEVGVVVEGSAAWEARLQPGDRVLAVGGKEMYSFENLGVEIALAGDNPVALTIERDGRQQRVDVLPHFDPARGLYDLGVGLPREDVAPPVAVTSGGPAAAAGLRSGDVLLAIDGLPTTGPDAAKAYKRLEAEPAPPLSLRLSRGEAEYEATVTPVPSRTPAPPLVGVRPQQRIVAGLRTGLPLVQELGLQRGDVLLAIDGEPFRGPEFSIPATDRGDLQLTVRRGDRTVDLRAPATAEQRAQLPEFVALTVDMDGMVLVPMPGGAAAEAGLQPGDRLLGIDGHRIASWDDLRSVVEDSAGRTLQLDLERRGATLDAPATNVSLAVEPQRRPALDYGFVPQISEKRHEVRADGFGDAIRIGFVSSIDLIKQLYVTMKRLLTGDVAAKNLGGIIQISRVSYQNTRWGLSRFLYFLALLSINLAFINVLPIPVLDGGHLLFLFIERIKGSPVSTKVLTYSQVLGLVFVLALVVFVTYNDILRLL